MTKASVLSPLRRRGGGACSRPRSRRAQTLRIGLAEDPDVLDPDARAHLRRPHRVRGAVRQAVRHRREAQHRPAARDQLFEWSADSKALTIKLRPGVTFHDGEKLDAAAVKYNIERHKTMPGSNRRGELAPVTTRRRRRSDDRAAQPVGAVLAAAGAARRSRRHDGLAQGGAGGRRQVRRPSRVLGPVPVRRARRAGPHRARALSGLLEQGRDPPRQDHLPADPRRDGAARQPEVGPARLHRAHGASDVPAAEERQPVQDREDHRDRLPGHHDQRRQERHGEEPRSARTRACARRSSSRSTATASCRW